MIVETYKVNFRVEAGKVKDAFAKVIKNSKEASKALKQTSKESADSASAMTEAFTGLVKKVLVVFAIGSVVKFVKDVAETSVRLKNMTFGTNTASKSLKGLENAFKMYGMSAQDADAGFEAFQKSVADLKFKGELGGIANVFNNIGVAMFDSKGKVRDYYDVLTDTGEKALALFKGDARKAREYLIGQGMDLNTATLVTQKNAKEIQKTMTEQAAASDRTAESYQELNRKIQEMDEKFQKMFLEFAERSGAIQILIDLLNEFSKWCTGEPSKSVTAFFTALDHMADAIKAVVVAITNMAGAIGAYIIQPVIKFFDLIGEAVSNITGAKYKSREKWFGNYNPTTIDLTGRGSVVGSSSMSSGTAPSMGTQSAPAISGGGFDAKIVNRKDNGFASIIGDIANQFGVDAGIMLNMASVESHFDTNAKSKYGSASGLFQFTTDTWRRVLNNLGGRKYGLTEGGRFDPRQNSIGAALVMKYYKKVLGRAGFPLTAENAYWCHFLGAERAVKFLRLLKQNPMATVGSLVGSFFTQGDVTGNGGYLKVGNTLAQTYRIVTGKVNTANSAALARRFGYSSGGGSGGGGIYAAPQAGAMNNATASAASSARVNKKPKRRVLPTAKTDSHDVQQTETSMLAGAFSGNISMLANLFPGW